MTQEIEFIALDQVESIFTRLLAQLRPTQASDVIQSFAAGLTAESVVNPATQLDRLRIQVNFATDDSNLSLGRDSAPAPKPIAAGLTGWTDPTSPGSGNEEWIETLCDQIGDCAVQAMVS